MPFHDEFHMGPGTYQIKLSLYEENRRRLLERLKLKKIKGAIVLLQGGTEIPLNQTDVSVYYRQEAFFQWTFGIQEADCFGALEVDTGKVIGFFPELPQDYAIWMGPIHGLDFFKNKYQLQEVHYTSEMVGVLKKSKPVLLVLKGVLCDSGLPLPDIKFDGMENFTINDDILFEEMCALRSIKSLHEIEVMRYVVSLVCEAHKQTMLRVKPGRYQYQCMSEFLRYCLQNGCKVLGFEAMCSSGKTNAILHYDDNDRIINDGEMCIFDMGSAYFGYSADITSSFPANGKFTDNQKKIYEAVLAVHQFALNKIKPGLSVECLHLKSISILLEHLKKIGLLRGEVKDMLDSELGYTFHPHGIGHLLGMDIHDVGGYLKGLPPPPTRKTAKTLRTARNFEKNMIFSIEPGCYFIDHLLEEAFSDPKLSKFLVKEVIDKFRDIGGVRLEDNILITDSGIELLGKRPRTVAEVEEWMAKAS